MTKIRGIHEAVLYASDLDAAEGFFAGVLGLPRLGDASDLMRIFRVAPEQVLLVFDPAKSEPAGREVPSHGARGPGHIALLVGAGELDAWRVRLEDAGIPIEQEVVWERLHGRSLYVRDPAGNSVELTEGDIWAPLV
ncbi:MAG: VOC family protein [Phycisphaerales bacterium]